MKTAVITGASRGIGLSTAKMFLDNGWRVIGTYNKKPGALTAPNFTSIHLDLASPESIAKAAREIKKTAPEINVLINNAGVSFGAFEAVPDIKALRKTFEVNVFGLFAFTEQLVANIAPGGHIVNISSRYGAFSFPIDGPDSTAYRMSKAALNMYTRTLSFRLKSKSIAVSAIHPGWVNTEMGNSAATGDEKPDREPEEAAHDIYALATHKVASGRFWQFGKERQW